MGEATPGHMAQIIARAKGQQPIIPALDIPEATRAAMGRVVKAARDETDLILPTEGSIEDQFMVVALAFIDTLTEKNDLASAYRHLFPRASQHKHDHAKGEAVRLLELCKASFPRVGDFMRGFFMRAGVHPAFLVNRLKQMVEAGRDTEALAAIKVILRLMELDAPDTEIHALVAAQVINPVQAPLAKRAIEAEVVSETEGKGKAGQTEEG